MYRYFLPEGPFPTGTLFQNLVYRFERKELVRRPEVCGAPGTDGYGGMGWGGGGVIDPDISKRSWWKKKKMMERLRG